MALSAVGAAPSLSSDGHSRKRHLLRVAAFAAEQPDIRCVVANCDSSE